MTVISVFDQEGEKLGDQPFSGTPLVGDCLLVLDHLYYIISRRWTPKGDLQLIVAPEGTAL